MDSGLRPTAGPGMTDSVNSQDNEQNPPLRIKDPLTILADGAERGVVVQAGRIAELVPAEHTLNKAYRLFARNHAARQTIQREFEIGRFLVSALWR
jgi:hypothetical protein